jgi:hypothetical protein
MKDIYPGWYAKTPNELEALWDQAILVPDTNILLHLLRHSAKVRSQLMDVFDRKKEWLWIPYRVGAEFQRRRLDVQEQALDAYDRLVDDLTTSVNQAKNKLNQYRAHPVIEIDRELCALDVYLADFLDRMTQAKAKHPTEELAASFTKVTELFKGRVGPKPSAERISAICKEGEERYAKKIPPGFEDAKKTGDASDKFGDLIIWKEMIEKAKADKRPMIFVTDDGKSDWWYINHGRKIGPHPELVEEFLAATGQQFHIYELPQFLRYAAETGSSIQAEAVKQIAEAMVADSEAAANQTADTGRSQVIKALRAELRGKEFELDGLIKSLIDYPPKSVQPGVPAPDDPKSSLKARIVEVTALLSALRDQLVGLEAAGEPNWTRTVT